MAIWNKSSMLKIWWYLQKSMRSCWLKIEGVDSNLCCGTHVNNLAHLQAIKLVWTESKAWNLAIYIYIYIYYCECIFRSISATNPFPPYVFHFPTQLLQVRCNCGMSCIFAPLWPCLSLLRQEGKEPSLLPGRQQSLSLPPTDHRPRERNHCNSKVIS